MTFQFQCTAKQNLNVNVKILFSSSSLFSVFLPLYISTLPPPLSLSSYLHLPRNLYGNLCFAKQQLQPRLSFHLCRFGAIATEKHWEWFFSPVSMEHDSGNSLSGEKQPLEASTSENEVKRPTENSATTSVFVNHAAIAWQQSRTEWIGDQSERSKRVPKDPLISWSTTYEDLLCSYEPFPEPIPLPEMVDFLVDIWQDEGLYD